MPELTNVELRRRVLVNIMDVRISLDVLKRDVSNGEGLGLSLPGFESSCNKLGSSSRDLQKRLFHVDLDKNPI